MIEDKDKTLGTGSSPELSPEAQFAKGMIEDIRDLTAELAGSKDSAGKERSADDLWRAAQSILFGYGASYLMPRFGEVGLRGKVVDVSKEIEKLSADERETLRLWAAQL